MGADQRNMSLSKALNPASFRDATRNLHLSVEILVRPEKELLLTGGEYVKLHLKSMSALYLRSLVTYLNLANKLSRTD